MAKRRKNFIIIWVHQNTGETHRYEVKNTTLTNMRKEVKYLANLQEVKTANFIPI